MKGDETARSYWEQRLASNLNLRGTGHRAFGLDYNHWLYAAQLDCMDRLVEQNQIDCEGQAALDVGSGSGVYVDYLLRKGVPSLIGVDIAEVSVAHLQQTYPTGRFYTLDIASRQWPFDDTFDVITAISVLYHIVDENYFQTALANLCQRLRPGGYMFLSDTFTTSWWPTARHARFRNLAAYETVLTQWGVQIIATLPLYFYLNRIYLPVLGPRLIDALGLGRTFYQMDTKLRASGRSNGHGMKLLLAKREGATG
jgi:2-polyprenyl-3-methyl-5-hydroxy-6-metoxy-1,4-benzoquinol methylase